MVKALVFDAQMANTLTQEKFALGVAKEGTWY
jgi:hypothetical protein